MKKILGLVVSLTAIAGVCAAVLAYVNALTGKPIAEMRVKKANEAAMAVMPAGVKEVSGADGFYVGKDASGNPIEVNRGLAERRAQIHVLKKRRSPVRQNKKRPPRQ